MLIIRNKQMEAMGAARAAPFIQEMLSRIRQRWPQQYDHLGEEGARQSVLAAITAGERYGLDEPEQLVSYITAMYTLDDHDFDQSPWASEILESAKMDGGLKMICIEDVVEQKVEEAEQEAESRREAEESLQAAEQP